MRLSVEKKGNQVKERKVSETRAVRWLE